MKNVINCLLFVLTAFQCFSQGNSEKLKTEQQRLERKISNTKQLLNKTKTSTAASLNELRLIDNQIKYREELVYNFDNQIRSAEVKMIEKKNEIKELYAKLIKLKTQYKKLLLYAYKHRNKFGKMMYIFSSTSYNEAVKRNNYLKKISDAQHKQFLIIRQHQSLIKEEITSIQKEKSYKLVVLQEKKEEKAAIEKDKVKQEIVYKKFKQEELKLIAQLKEDERKKDVLKRKIQQAIQQEIAAAEAKRKKEEQKRLKEEAEASKSTTTASTSTSSGTAKSERNATTKTIAYTETKESAALSRSFEGNKGRLPWPVDKGALTEGFGRNPHPTLDNVYTNNNGIDISTPKNASVRCVFDGEVSSVLNIPGAGKVVIIKHGNYRTVYSNLQEIFVKVGSKVSTKQSIGSLMTKESGSVIHFEIHLVSGSAVQCLNPGLWVSH